MRLIRTSLAAIASSRAASAQGTSGEGVSQSAAGQDTSNDATDGASGRVASGPAAVDSRGSVVTIGNFDGVHLGHVHMLDAVTREAKRLGLPGVVVTFEPLPHEYFSGDAAPARLQGLRDRLASLEAAGVDKVLLLNFDADLAALRADEFIDDILIATLQVRHLVVGDDFRFGYRREGDHARLQAAGLAGGFPVSACDTFDDGLGRVSSTRIRRHLQAGELAPAAALLGRPYRISGRVIHGEKVGRQLGFPTANVRLGRHRPPLAGVFAVKVTDRDTGHEHDGVANLGERPTMGGRRLLLEVNVLDGAPQLYGHHLAVDFLHFIRGEQRFDSLDALKRQIATDAATARALLRQP